MEKKILVAVDGSVHSRKAMEYIASMGSIVKRVQYVLFNVQPKISEFLTKDAKTDARAIATLKEVNKENQANSVQILEEAKAFMVKKGVDEKMVEILSTPHRRGTTKGILDNAKRAHCAAIVMGHRGVTRITESFVGSTTNSVLDFTKATPVWAVGGEVKSRKMMVAIDGSESSLRAVDHLSFMIGGNPELKITLLHVTPRLRDYCTIDFHADEEVLEEVIVQGDKNCVDSFYIHAKQRFRKAGIQENQVLIREVASNVSIGKTIATEAKKGKFGTIVIGRSGLNNSFFMGSVSRYVINQAPDCAVWLVP